MRRPYKPRTTRGSSPPNPILSRIPLLQPYGDSDSNTPRWDVGEQIPGFRIPIAFLSSLRTNLQISYVNDDPFAREAIAGTAPDAQDTLLPHHHVYGPARHMPKGIDIDEKTSRTKGPLTPEFKTFKATREDDMLAALRIISEGVAQQQQIAVKSMVTHPAVGAASIIIFLTVAKLLYTGVASDFLLMFALWTLFALLGLIAIKVMVNGYADLACNVGNWAWLSGDRSSNAPAKRDEVLVTQVGDEVVGAVVFRIAKTEPSTPRPTFSSRHHRSPRHKSSARWTAIIRAWSVKHEYQHRGIGTALLEETVRIAKLRGLDGPIFAEDHANSQMILPGIFNSQFRNRERWARALLEYVIEEQKA